MEFSKSDIQKLFNIKSERLSYENVDGKSTVWKQFARVKVDDAPVSFVKCARCSALLKWNSRDGTSSLKAHVDYCASKLPQTKISDFTQQRQIACTTVKIPSFTNT